MSFNLITGRLHAIFRGPLDYEISYEEVMTLNNSSGLYDDIYVVHYDFEDLGNDLAHGNETIF